MQERGSAYRQQRFCDNVFHVGKVAFGIQIKEGGVKILEEGKGRQ